MKVFADFINGILNRLNKKITVSQSSYSETVIFCNSIPLYAGLIIHGCKHTRNIHLVPCSGKKNR